jgi:hypothetical protein
LVNEACCGHGRQGVGEGLARGGAAELAAEIVTRRGSGAEATVAVGAELRSGWVLLSFSTYKIQERRRKCAARCIGLQGVNPSSSTLWRQASGSV